MKDSYFVIFNRNGIERFAKSGKFQLNQGEFAQQVELNVDDLLFSPVRVPAVSIHVNALGVARVIDADVSEEGDDEAGQ